MGPSYGGSRTSRRRRRRRRVMINRAIFAVVILALLGGIAFGAVKLFGGDSEEETKTVFQTGESGEESGSSEGDNPGTESQPSETTADSTQKQAIMDEAAYIAAGYDYDGAVALLQTIPGYENDAEVTAAIDSYLAIKATCVQVDPTKVPHIFYHSLVNDPVKAFDFSRIDSNTVNGFNAWMTTTEEFDKITQQMYDNGWVFVMLSDLYEKTVDEDGDVHFKPATDIYLPPDKKAVVLSLDDLSYYHVYEIHGYPEKLVFDENGDVKCLYTDADGNTSVGDYDVVPRLNTFLEAHPDGAYKGARGTIALTGYNGVFGYRTDIDYLEKARLQSGQKAWLDAHPEFDYYQDIEDAKKIAEALKEDGWEFASHTWGHQSVGLKTAEQLRVDNEKWVNTVQNIVGETEIIIFAHGTDIAGVEDYSMDNEKYAMFKEAGYNVYCNVDGSALYWNQFRDDYVRQGRINVDGYMMWQHLQGNKHLLDDMFDVESVFDSRRPTPVIITNSKD